MARSTAYYRPQPVSDDDLRLMRLVDEIHLELPFHGSRRVAAIMDWHSRRVLSWRISNTLDSTFCVEVLEEALARHGTPEIFNTDQDAQFTSEAFTSVLKTHDVSISMDGRGRWLYNVFAERLWRSVKYETIYLRAYETPASLRANLTRYFDFYNCRRRDAALDRRTPDAVRRRQRGSVTSGGICT